MAIKADDVAAARMLPRTLAGATILQIITALDDDAVARATLDIAKALVHAGARAIVAGRHGSLVDEIKAFGGEWLPLASATLNPLRLRRNADRLATFIADERIDIVHAKNPGAAWSAFMATDGEATRLVTDLPDLPRPRRFLGTLRLGALSRGDRVIVRSLFHAQPMIERYRIPQERLSVIPRSVDTTVFDPTAVRPERVAALRYAWGVPSGMRIVMAPGRVAPWNGQIHLVDAAARLARIGVRGVTFVLVGDDQRFRRYVRSIRRTAQQQGVEHLFRIVGHVPDMPAAYAAADIVVAPCIAPPLHGRVVAEAQIMARPVIASSVGPLPENLVVPPRMPKELRTGWVVPPGSPVEIARALAEALSLDAEAYHALAARARQFGEFMFSPRRIATVTLGVYSSLLEASA